MQPREWQLHLGLHPRNPGNVKARSLPDAMVQQRRLTDPSLTAHDHSRALATTDLLQKPAQLVALCVPALQDRRAVSRHGQHPITPNTRVQPGHSLMRRRGPMRRTRD